MSDSFVTSWTVGCQVSLSMGSPKLEYWSGLPFPSPGNLPNSGTKHTSPALAGRFFTTEPLGKPQYKVKNLKYLPCSIVAILFSKYFFASWLLLLPCSLHCLVRWLQLPTNWSLCVSCLLLLLFSYPVMSDSLWSHGLQHTMPPCPSPSPEVCPSSCPLHQWFYLAISSPEALFSFHPQSFPLTGTFPMSQLFTSDDLNTGVSASASVLLMSIQGWSPLRLTGLIYLLSSSKVQFFSTLPPLWAISYNCTWPLGRP